MGVNWTRPADAEAMARQATPCPSRTMTLPRSVWSTRRVGRRFGCSGRRVACKLIDLQSARLPLQKKQKADNTPLRIYPS